ncbi:MAG: hypothetical protein WC727_03580 [Ignavibacteriaceae bacterium]|jgi:hypothetical protein
MKIKFVIDAKYDAKMIWHMLQMDDWKYRAGMMDINEVLGEKIHISPEIEVEEELNSLVKKEYDRTLPFIEQTSKQYQSSWDEIIEDFSQTVEQLTYPWFYDEYVCVVTNFHPGISNWNGNLIGRWWKENSYLQRRITAHEILLAHYFSIHCNYFKDSGLTDKQIWALAEIAAFAITGIESKITKFWPWDKNGYYTNHNYPHIVELQNQLRDPFKNRKDFREYIETGIKLVKNFPDLS